MRFLILTFGIFTAIILLETIIVGLISLSLPNSLTFELIQNIGMYWDLFSTNPSIAFSLFVQQPLVIIQKIDFHSGTQLWGIYIMPLTVMVLLGLSAFVVFLGKVVLMPNIWPRVLSASILLCAAIFYLRVQVCCSEDPAWLLDVMLLSQVFDPLTNTAHWQEIYLALAPWFSRIQIGMVVVALTVLYISFSSTRSSNTN